MQGQCTTQIWFSIHFTTNSTVFLFMNAMRFRKRGLSEVMEFVFLISLTEPLNSLVGSLICNPWAILIMLLSIALNFKGGYLCAAIFCAMYCISWMKAFNDHIEQLGGFKTIAEQDGWLWCLIKRPRMLTYHFLNI